MGTYNTSQEKCSTTFVYVQIVYIHSLQKVSQKYNDSKNKMKNLLWFRRRKQL